MASLMDRLVYKEMLGPWLFGVAMFSVLLMAGTYLFRLTDFFVRGVEPSAIIELSLLYAPRMIVPTFPMAVLLASLLAFSRLSNDAETIALQAGGSSLWRMLLPVMMFGLLVTAITFTFQELIVPNASQRAVSMTSELLRKIGPASQQNFYQPIYVNNEYRGSLMAKDVNLKDNTLYEVVLAWYVEGKTNPELFFFKEFYYGEDKRWRIREGVAIRDEGDRIIRTKLQDAEPPPGVILDITPKDLLSQTVMDTDTMGISDIGEQVKKMKNHNRVDHRKLRNLEVGYWTKISFPFTALVFALVGAPLAIRRVRQGISAGVATSVFIIFAYYILQSYLTILARGGKLAPEMGAFGPLAIGLVVAIMLILYRNH